MSPSNTSFRKLGALKPEAAGKVKAAAQAPHPVEDKAAAAPGQHPGVERWPVKTGTDLDVSKVGVNRINGADLGPGIVDTTIAELRALPRPSNMPAVHKSFPLNSYYQDRRATTTETTVWRVKATITEAKLEQDGDYHLVLKDKGQTMIGEIPDPDPAYVKNAVWLADIKLARGEMDKKLGKPLKAVDFKPEDMGVPTEVRKTAVANQEAAMTQVGAQATIIGVGFFDSSHGQTGVAPNAIELHPIFSIQFH